MREVIKSLTITMSTTEDHNELQVYELGYLILPSVPEESLSDVVTRLKGLIKKAGGKEIAGEDPFKMDLAYEMSKSVSARKYIVKEAYIGWTKFEVEPSAVPELNEELKKVEEVLRFLLVKAPRETTFTFALARKAIEEAEAAKAEAERAAKAPEAPQEEKVVE
jgi:ribosomal protein S6